MSHNRLVYLFLNLLALGMASPSWGNWSIIPAASLKEEYTDNLHLSHVRRVDSFITTFSPGILLQEASERGSVGISARLSLIDYSRDGDLKSLEQRYNGLLNYMISPLVTLNATAGFSYESRPEREIEQTGLAISRTSRRQDYGGAFQHRLNEVSTGTLSYGYGETNFVGDAASDVASHTASYSILHDLERYLPRTRLRVQAGFTRADYANTTISNYSTGVTAHYALHELWVIDAGVGGRYTHSDFSLVELSPSTGFTTTGESTSRAGWTGNVTVSYKTEYLAANLRLGRDLVLATGRAGATESTQASLTLSQRFTAELFGTLAAGVYDNASRAGEFSSNTIDEMTLRVSPGLSYAVTPDLNLNLSYEYNTVRNRSADTVARQNKVFLLLSWQYPLHE